MFIRLNHSKNLFTLVKLGKNSPKTAPTANIFSLVSATEMSHFILWLNCKIVIPY